MNNETKILDPINNEGHNFNSSNDEIVEEITNEVVFAKDICYSKLFWLFMIGCFIGTYYEQVVTLIREQVWVSRQGVIYGPFNPVYGFGLVLFIVLLYKFEEWWKVFLLGAFIGGSFEYMLSYLQEFFLNSTSWNYRHHFLNINGRTTIPFMIFWGLLSLVVMKYIYPSLNQVIEKVPIKIGKITTIVFSIFMIFNMVLTGVVLLRQAQRTKLIKPSTIVGQLIDEYYSDEYLNEVFPNMTKYD